MLDFQDLADLGFTVSILNLDNFAPMANFWANALSAVGWSASRLSHVLATVGRVVRVTAVRQQANR